MLHANSEPTTLTSCPPQLLCPRLILICSHAIVRLCLFTVVPRPLLVYSCPCLSLSQMISNDFICFFVLVSSLSCLSCCRLPCTLPVPCLCRHALANTSRDAADAVSFVRLPHVSDARLVQDYLLLTGVVLRVSLTRHPLDRRVTLCRRQRSSRRALHPAPLVRSRSLALSCLTFPFDAVADATH